MIIDETRFIWNNLMDILKPARELYSQMRPWILLPFNIWFFFASLPFRLFFAFSSAMNRDQRQPASEVLREKAMELKETVKSTVLPKTTQTHTVSAKSLEMMEQRPHGWYAVDKSESIHKRKSSSKSLKGSQLEKSQEEQQPREEISREEPREEPREEVNWNEKLSEMEKRVQRSSEEKLRLEAQLEELNKKYTDDEKYLASFEQEKRRYKNLIHVEQKKCYDSQQTIIALKNQLKSEHESRMKAEEQLKSSKKQEAVETKKKSKKERKAEAKEAAKETQEASSETHTAWNSDHHMGYTEMVASAQLEESKHKKFSEVLKESIAPVADLSKSSEQSSEFVVVGGDLSSKHIIAAPQILSSN